MSVQRLWVATLLFLLLCTSNGCQSAVGARLTAWFDQSRAAGYGEKVFYFQAQPIAFPDFTLTYQGVRHVTAEKYPRGFDYHDFQVDNGAEKYPRGFDYHDFQVDNGDESQIIAWSSGAGDIGPSFFTVASQQYKLELTYSDELGRLAAGELVIWRE